MITVIISIGLFSGIIGVIQPKLRRICGGMLFIAIFLTMVLNNGNVDYYSYQRNYNMSAFEHENLFSLLEFFFKSIGFTYAQFFALVMGASLILIAITVNKLNINASGFFLLYFLYPFCLDIIQVRNFLAYSIIFFAFPWLLIKDRRHKIYYTIAVLIAASIHLSCIVYILIIFYEAIKESKRLKIIFGSIVFVFILLTLNVGRLSAYLTFFQTNIYRYLQEGRVYEMSVNNVGERGFIIFYAIHFSNILLQYFCLRSLKNQENEEVLTYNRRNIIVDVNTGKQYIEIVMWLSIVLTLFIPLYRFQATLFRITRNLMIFNYSGFLVYTRIGNDRNKKRIVTLLYFLLVAFLFWFEVYRGYNRESIFGVIFQNNWLN